MALIPVSQHLSRRTRAVVQAALSGEVFKIPSDVLVGLEQAFGVSLSAVRLHLGPQSHRAAGIVKARAFTVGSHVVLADPVDVFNIPLLAHEITHVIQSSSSSIAWELESRDADAEQEAKLVAARVAAGRSAGPIQATLARIACTPTSDSIRRLTSYAWNDWAVTSAEQKQVLTLLQGDSNPIGTVQDLNATGSISDLFHRMDPGERLQLAQLIGGRVDEATAAAIRAQIVFFPRGKADVADNSHLFPFDVSNQLQNRLRSMGLVSAAPAFNTASLAGLVGKSSTAPFSGAGATGVSPKSQPSIPMKDQYYMWKGVDAFLKLYDNPLDDLNVYLASLTPLERRQQASLLLRMQISSIVPYSYAGKVPSRAEVMTTAAAKYNLHPAVIAAFILAEQRDQSANEDAKDYQAAISILQKNTSIGLGQVVISTARKYNLFADVLSKPFIGFLTHNQIALLLTSDEFNIFAAARYLRLTADAGALIPTAALPKTAAAFPGLDMPAYSKHSSQWPEANIAALGSEYTSTAWDDKVTGWGPFVLDCYHDVVASGVF